MIEVTCAACGSTQRFQDADAGKVSSCAQCKARMTVPRALPSIPSPGSGGGTGDVINLSDLPAPKRPSPLAGAAGRPPPLPGARRPGAPPATPPIDLSALEMDSIDLPAPVGPEPRGLIDLPAPVGPTSRGITDLPAPVGPSPRGAQPRAASPALRQGSLDADLPAPVGPTSRGITDLPAPVGPTSRGITDLPTPVGPTSRGITDLPTPVGPTSRGITDLPTPVGPTSRGITDLPAPRGGRGDIGVDLPAPKRAGGPAFDDGLDLPAPSTGGVDLPAPKGFFDDLPAPRSAPSTGGVDLPAPKGFFDDLPAPRGAQASSGLPTPKPASPDLPAPKGFFDDLPGPRGGAAAAPTAAPTARPRGMDLDDLDLAPPTQPPMPRVSAPPTGAAQAATARTAGPVPLDLGGDSDVPPLELDGPSDRYGGLDLPSVAPAGTDAAKAQAQQAQTMITGGGGVSFKPGGHDGGAHIHVPKPDSLDLDIDDTKRGDASKRGGQVAERTTNAAPGAVVVKPKMDPKKRRLIMLGVAALVVLGAVGGVLLYKRWQAERDRLELRDKLLADARRSLLSGNAKHWEAAANAAAGVLDIDGNNAEALGIAAQAYVAGYLEDGTNEKKRRSAADKVVDKIHARSARGLQVEKGLALYGVINNDAAGSVTTLAELSTTEKDPDVFLYLGWAYAERRQWDEAIEAFSVAADAKNRAVPATYNVGLAQLAKGDLAAAKASFSVVNDLANHAHLGAEVGIHAAMPPDDYARRESEIISILNKKEIEKADPRVVAWAWALAGDDARRAGRLDAAKDRYEKAIALQPGLLSAIVGNAELALRAGQLKIAEQALEEALIIAPDDPDANLATIDRLIRQNQPSEASSYVIKLKANKLPTAEQQVRLHMLDGLLQEKLENDEAAVSAYAAAQTAAGPGDIGPAVAQATLLGKLATKARTANNATLAADYAARSAKLLDELETKAKDDPASQLALGRAFLAAGNGAKAEEYLRKGLVSRKDDIEANFQLVEALQLQGKFEEAAAAAMIASELDPSRTDMMIKLAETLEAAGRIANATEIYEKILADPAVSVNTRVKTGMYWTRHAEFSKAGVQGEAILVLEPKHAAGFYLRGEAAYAEKRWDDARKAFTLALENDPNQAIYAEGIGRSTWQQSVATDEPQMMDKALIAYQEAARLDPKMLSAQLGRAQLHLLRKEYPLALEGYQAASLIAPEHVDIPYGIGVCYHEQLKNADALPWLLKSVKIKPQADAWYRIARIYGAANDPKKEGPALAKATELAIQEERDGKPAQPWLMDALWTQGSRLRDAGKDSAACAAWDRWLARDPKDQLLRNNTEAAMLGMRCPK